MDKIKNIILLLLPLMFFSLLMLYIFQRQEVNHEKQEQIFHSKLDSVKMGEIYKYILSYSSTVTVPIAKEMLVTDSTDHNFSLKQLINKKTFIYHFDETNCFDCIEKFLPYLEKLNVKLGKNKVIILGSFEKSENLFLTLKSYHLSIPVYNLKPEYLRNTKLGELNTPYLFEVDHTFNTSKFFIPEKGLPGLSTYYLTQQSILEN